MAELEAARYSTVPVSAGDTSPAHWIRPIAVLPLLERIEQLPEGSTGALMLGRGSNGQGVILVENGRICWAAASEMKRRLTDLLRHQTVPALTTSSIEAVYETCREDKKPLGEALVESGLIEERGLWRALRQHNAEAIALISTGGAPLSHAEFKKHKNQRYDARFTFSTTEILATLGALADRDAATLARNELKITVPSGDYGAAFVRDRVGAGLIPIGEVGNPSVTSEQLMEIGNWANSTLDVAAAVANEVRIVTGTSRNGQSIVAWTTGLIIYMALCSSLPSYARLVSSLSRRMSQEH